jgi:hypothetical protein
MRNGSHSLREFPLAVVRIDCPRCEQAGSYRRDGLMARLGADAALPDVLLALASCERRADLSRPCGRAVHGLGRKSTHDRHAWREPICLRIYVDWRRAIRGAL